MFKKPDSPTFFKEHRQHKHQLKEEKIFIRIIRDQARQKMIDTLSKELEHEPSPQEVEEALDILIERLRKDGTIQKMLDKYLQQKIADQRAQYGHTPATDKKRKRGAEASAASSITISKGGK